VGVCFPGGQGNDGTPLQALEFRPIIRSSLQRRFFSEKLFYAHHTAFSGDATARRGMCCGDRVCLPVATAKCRNKQIIKHSWHILFFYNVHIGIKFTR